MRVTHNMMFTNMNANMNNILGNYMESGIQMSSQKRVNRPSDDPTSTVRIFDYRASIVANDTFINNSKEADSWLKSTDGALQQAQGILTRITELAEQASTGTITYENRMQISFELEQLFGQLINIANKYIEDKKPWELNKEGNVEAVNNLLNLLSNIVRVVFFWLQPVLVDGTKMAAEQFNLDFSKITFETIDDLKTLDNHKVNTSSPIYIRRENKEN